MTQRVPRDTDSLLPSSLPPIGINRLQAAEFIGVSPSFFDQMVAAGTMPQPRRAGSRTIWDVAELTRAFRALPQAPRIGPGNGGDGDDAYETAFGG